MDFISPIIVVIVTTIVFFVCLKLILIFVKKNQEAKYLKEHGHPKSSQPPPKGPNDDLDDLLFQLISANKSSGQIVNELLDKGYTMKDIHHAYERFSLKNPHESSKHKHL